MRVREVWTRSSGADVLLDAFDDDLVSVVDLRVFA